MKAPSDPAVYHAADSQIRTAAASEGQRARQVLAPSERYALAGMNDRTFRVAAAAVVLLAAIVRFDGLASGLPHPNTRPDEILVVHEMARPARGVFELKLLIYPNAYVYATWLWVEAGLRVAPLFGVDPPGGFQRTLLLAPEILFLIGRAFSATAGTLTVLLSIWLVRRR